MAIIQERIKQLREEISKHDELYEINKPIISDGEYDKLYQELVELEKKYPEFYDPNSPTQKIITKMVDELKKVRHNSFIGSQAKENNWEGVAKFISKADSDILVQYKLDGLTIVLHYENGKLAMAVTRGDGEIGEDVTHTVETIRNVPKEIDFIGKLEVRMEVIIPFKEFERINQNGEYSNPRNLASGTIRQLDARIAKKRNLQGIVFEAIEIEGREFKNDLERLLFLKDLGFEIVETKCFKQTEKEEMKRWIEIIEHQKREKLPYMIDGLIIKFNNLSVRESLGSTSKHPRWSIAYKFEAQESTTILKSITPQVGKTGQITPVAELETVTIDGVNISRASLHNYGNIADKDIRIGDTVVVVRANDVIPQITSAIKEKRKGNEVIVKTPLSCPICGSKTEFIGANLYCTGLDCEPQLQGKIEHFASRQALNIDGLGKNTIATFFNKGIVRNFLDLYRLEDKKEDILSIEGFGEKKFNKILNGLEEAKKAPLSKVITALSIRLIGTSNAKTIANEFVTMDTLLDASKHKDEFYKKVINLDGFGKEMTDSLVEFFSNEQNREIIQSLLKLGFTMKEDVPKENNINKSIYGKTFVITGTLSKSRNEFKETIETMGGKVSGSVSKKTDYLLMGGGAEGSSKHKKAMENNITILSEKEFWNLVQ